eukprot:4862951-Pyramimonas_sp.AAC.2
MRVQPCKCHHAYRVWVWVYVCGCVKNGVGKVLGRGGSAPRVTFEKTKKSSIGTYHSADATMHMKSSFGEEEVSPSRPIALS